MALTIITPAMPALPGHHTEDAHGKQGTHLLHLDRERQLWIKMHCLKAYALGGFEPPTL